MLTAHSLCWLCQMPLAVARWGICSRCSRALLACPPLCPQRGLHLLELLHHRGGGGTPSPLRPLPAKAASLASAGGGQ